MNPTPPAYVLPPFTVTWIGTPGNPDVTRSYGSFSQLSDEQARSRVYAGIHFTFEPTASEKSCVQVADYVADNYMLPRHAYGDRRCRKMAPDRIMPRLVESPLANTAEALV